MTTEERKKIKQAYELLNSISSYCDYIDEAIYNLELACEDYEIEV